MKMEARKIDANMRPHKFVTAHSVKVIFSDVRFKRFIFAAKKEIREQNRDLSNGLFINENLTSFNYKI